MRHLKEVTKEKGRVSVTSKSRYRLAEKISIGAEVTLEHLCWPHLRGHVICVHFNIPAPSGLCQLLPLLLCYQTSETRIWFAQEFSSSVVSESP
jgi:hypothetical protein